MARQRPAAPGRCRQPAGGGRARGEIHPPVAAGILHRPRHADAAGLGHLARRRTVVRRALVGAHRLGGSRRAAGRPACRRLHAGRGMAAAGAARGGGAVHRRQRRAAARRGPAALAAGVAAAAHRSRTRSRARGARRHRSRLGRLTLGGLPLDDRPGVGVRLDARRKRLVPDIDWVEVPAGEFRYGEKNRGSGCRPSTSPAIRSPTASSAASSTTRKAMPTPAGGKASRSGPSALPKRPGTMPTTRARPFRGSRRWPSAAG
jgi:hypothetical protein